MLLVDSEAGIDGLFYGPHSYREEWIRAGLEFDDGRRLLLHDPRRLARVEIAPDLSELGPDALSLTNDELARFAPYDVVLSDMAPRTTGNRVTDQARSFDLFMRALSVAATLGAKGGAFVGKIFMSDDLPAARAELRKHYASERLIRPEGTRTVSYEIFAIGQGKRGEKSA